MIIDGEFLKNLSYCWRPPDDRDSVAALRGFAYFRHTEYPFTRRAITRDCGPIIATACSIANINTNGYLPESSGAGGNI